ncbi:hypothetical protein JF546_05015 [Nitratireductor aquimarinus]|uniref:hypothetical protein n=1 Tax=Nitratireductor aquimarinus TaxID=889300 RepID=UPI001A8D821A|nr:hypothetical protein [Nitratireductor aquimarinus]MBN8242364.1 hypothetical protein [Nitratireductor aquimarinus]MBY6130751.1 hypothetical protein [Nitratireductor aquimarinus]MCA1302493.1 hypothetical protein [Nitratireductor aquimarinus]
MHPDYFVNPQRQFLASSPADAFVPQPMTVSELEDEFPPLALWSCAITKSGNL